MATKTVNGQQGDGGEVLCTIGNAHLKLPYYWETKYRYLVRFSKGTGLFACVQGLTALLLYSEDVSAFFFCYFPGVGSTANCGRRLRRQMRGMEGIEAGATQAGRRRSRQQR